MRAVFADTSFFLAILGPRDPTHGKALAINGDPQLPVVTTEWVLLEGANFFSKRSSRRLFQVLVEGLSGQGHAEIIPASTDLFSRGCDLYFSRLDKEWSLTDCISFVVMQDRNLTDALTGDHHFEQAGFRALLR